MLRKKIICSAVLAAVLLVSGCSSEVSRESYNSVVEENSKLKNEKSSLESKNNSLQSENDSLREENDSLDETSDNEEYRMPKEHVKRIAKVLTMPEDSRAGNNFSTSTDIDQYNLKCNVSIDFYSSNGKNQLKCICNITTDNTLQEKAAFVHYFVRVRMDKTVESEITEYECENVVFVVNDNKGSPVAVWLAYELNGEIIHDMCIVDTEVYKALDEVMLDVDIWGLRENQSTQTIDEPSTENSESSGSKEPIVQKTYANPSGYSKELNQMYAQQALSDILDICSPDYFSEKKMTSNEAEAVKAAASAADEYLKENELLRTASLINAPGINTESEMQEQFSYLLALAYIKLDEIRDTISNSADVLVSAEFGSTEYETAQAALKEAVERLEKSVYPSEE